MRKWLRQAHIFAAESIRDQQHGSVFVDPVGDRRISAGCNLVPSQVTEITTCELSATTTAITFAARSGTPLRGCVLYTTEPTSSATEAKILILLGVKTIIRHAAKPVVSGIDEMLVTAGIDTEYYDRPVLEYPCSKQL